MKEKHRWMLFWALVVLIVVAVIVVLYYLGVVGKRGVVKGGGEYGFNPIGGDEEEEEDVEKFIQDMIDDVMHPENGVCPTLRDGNMFKREREFLTLPKDKYASMQVRYHPKFDYMQTENSGFSVFYRVRKNGPDGEEFTPNVTTQFKIARDGRQSNSSHPLVWEIDPLTCTFTTEKQSTKQTFTLRENRWYDVLFSYQVIPFSKIRVRVIVDGKIITEEDGDFNFPSGSSPNFVIGSTTMANLPLVESFSIRDVALYEDPLFEKGKPLDPANDTYNLDELIPAMRKNPGKVKNLFAYYRLGIGDSPELSMAHDMSPNCFHGDLVGAAQYDD